MPIADSKIPTRTVSCPLRLMLQPNGAVVTKEDVQVDIGYPGGWLAPLSSCARDNGGCGNTYSCKTHPIRKEAACYPIPDASSFLKCPSSRVLPGRMLNCTVYPKRDNIPITTVGDLLSLRAPPSLMVDNPMGAQTQWAVAVVAGYTTRGRTWVALFVDGDERPVKNLTLDVSDRLESGDPAPDGSCGITNGGCPQHFLCERDCSTGTEVCVVLPDATSAIVCASETILGGGGNTSCVLFPKRRKRPVQVTLKRLMLRVDPDTKHVLSKVEFSAELDWNCAQDRWKFFAISHPFAKRESSQGFVQAALADVKGLIAEAALTITMERPTGDEPPKYEEHLVPLEDTTDWTPP